MFYKKILDNKKISSFDLSFRTQIFLLITMPSINKKYHHFLQKSWVQIASCPLELLLLHLEQLEVDVCQLEGDLLHLDDVGLRVKEGEADLQTLDAPPEHLADPVQVVIVVHLLYLEGGQVLVHLAQHLVCLHPLRTVLLEREKCKGKIEMFGSLAKDRLCFIPVFCRNGRIMPLKLEDCISAIC